MNTFSMKWEESLIIEATKNRLTKPKNRPSSEKVNTLNVKVSENPDLEASMRDQQIKAVREVYHTLEVFLAIFDAASRVLPRYHVAKVQWDYSSSPPLCWLVPSGPHDTTDHTSTDVPENLIWAVRKHMMCDFSVMTMFTAIQKKLRSYGATLQWLTLQPQAKHVFAFGDPSIDPTRPPRDQLLPTHSVFLVTIADGRKYIADFTTEQFGYDRSQWFDDPQDFLQQRAEPPHRYDILNTAGIDSMPLHWQAMEDLRRWMKRFCAELDWAEVEAVREGDRPAAVYDWAMKDFVGLVEVAREEFGTWLKPFASKVEAEEGDSPVSKVQNA